MFPTTRLLPPASTIYMLSDDKAFKKQLHGWLSYAFARYVDIVVFIDASVNVKDSEVFVVVSLTLFLPICLEQFARDNVHIHPLRCL